VAEQTFRPEPEDRVPWWGRVSEIMTRWLTAQTFNNILLLTIIVGGAYIVVKMVPIHLQEIQRGYEKEGTANRELIQRLDDNHREERLQTFEYFRELINSRRVAGQ
jgi:hypothetical protein